MCQLERFSGLAQNDVEEYGASCDGRRRTQARPGPPVALGAVTAPPALPVDRLGDDRTALEVVLLRGASFGGARVRAPHRHDYHELLWIREGRGEHRIDGVRHPVRPGAVTVIGRGQVHVFERGEDLEGAVVRFGADLVVGASAGGWLLDARADRVVPVPAGETAVLEDVLGALAAEAGRPPDARTDAVQRHLLSTVLLWIERWYDEARLEHPDPDAPEVRLQRRFAARLEEDFPRHHDAGHYAQVLGVPAAALSRALTAVTGRGTKELVTERVMLEARRLLRFTDLGVAEVAHRVGFTDPLYFSRAFKRAAGESPQAFRARARGR